ncbi:MAG: metal-dependent hydrolase [Calditerrivibrio sp.]|nr:metal-dependent hydrolase [Calditerrivibrio sp.]MCA1980055.1 metal-dependent hydrolase [Calditerrivibrio sp.]
MDPITHFISGIVAKNYLTKKEGIFTTIIYGSVTMSPDIDNFVGTFGTPFTYILHHRGFTHSFIGGFLLAIILFLISKMIKYEDKNVLRNFYILILIHIFLDIMTSYGTQILLPFSNSRIALDSMFIIDPIYLILLVILYFTAKKYKKLIFLSWLFIFIYPTFNFFIKSTYEMILAIRENKKIYVTAAPLSPLFWKVIREDEKNYYVNVTFLDGDLTEYKKLSPETLILLEKDNNLKIFKWFLRFPYGEEKIINGEKYLYIRDLRFSILGRESPFTLRLIKKDNTLNYKMGNFNSSITID